MASKEEKLCKKLRLLSNSLNLYPKNRAIAPMNFPSKKSGKTPKASSFESSKCFKSV
jgi:hypothetical protein